MNVFGLLDRSYGRLMNVSYLCHVLFPPQAPRPHSPLHASHHLRPTLQPPLLNRTGYWTPWHPITSPTTFTISRCTRCKGPDNVIIGDGMGHPITHMGSTSLPFSTVQFRLNNVMHVSSMSQNLVFTIRLSILFNQQCPDSIFT